MSTTTKSKHKLTVTFTSDISSQATHEDANAESSPGSKGGRKSKIAEYIALSTVPLVLVLGNSMLVPILPTLRNKLGISQFQSSLVISLFSLCAAIIIPFAGYLSDRFSRKAVIIPSLIVYGGAGILAGFGALWDSYGVLISARALQGIGAAGTAPIAMALVGDMYKNGQESQALGLIEASNGTGKVVSPILGSLLALIVWYAAFFAFPAFCLLSLLAVLFFIKEPKRQEPPPPVKQYVQSIKRIFSKNGRWLVSSFFGGSLALFILFGVLFFLSDILEKPPYSIEGVRKGFVLAIPLFGMVATAYVTGTVIRKNGVLMRWLMNIGLALMVVSLALAIWLNTQLYVFIGLLTVSSIGTGLLLPCLNTMITGAVEKAERGMITSLYSSLRFFGVAFGPPLFGWLMGISHQIVFITVSLLSLVALGLVFFLVKPGKQVQ
ncbi:MFS transporter [Cohnella cholangitidis]|uniref:MFS transporter n=1 Tax=Cohnella cholangitidis TaxID=2598458 RepID=A0A7G5C3U6_9BACL|nr:MFS transporter [Cohnella cholangitidis]QMV43880.1 MFS transporter [Cohnella cholangitidis]